MVTHCLVGIHKSYYALDRDMCIGIIASYRVGPRDIRFIYWYWDCLIMVDRDGGYFGTPFKGFWGFTQGDPLSSTIFNVVLDAVIWKWMTVVAEKESVSKAFGREVQGMTPFIYVENLLLTSTHPEWLQGEFNVVTGIFDHVSLWMNYRKPIGMVYQPCREVGRNLE